MYLSIEKLVGGNSSKSLRNANNLELRSFFTSIFNAVVDGPPRFAIDTAKENGME